MVNHNWKAGGATQAWQGASWVKRLGCGPSQAVKLITNKVSMCTQRRQMYLRYPHHLPDDWWSMEQPNPLCCWGKLKTRPRQVSWTCQLSEEILTTSDSHWHIETMCWIPSGEAGGVPYTIGHQHDTAGRLWVLLVLSILQYQPWLPSW